MSIEPKNNASLLGPLEGEYEPSQADADRVFAKIEASLLAAPAAQAPAPPSPALPKAAARGGRNLFLFSASCVVLALAGFAVHYARSSRPDDVPVAVVTHAPSPSPATTADEAPREAIPAVTAIPSISVDSLPSANVVHPSTPTPSPASTGADTLEREARLLADARRAEQRGDGQAALALLDEHAREFPKGWLASDRAVEHIVVLCSLGRKPEAAREANAFLQGRVESPLTRRVAASCAGQPREHE